MSTENQPSSPDFFDTTSPADDFDAADNQSNRQFYATRPFPSVEQRIELALMTYVLPAIIAVGTVGNVLSFVVLLRPRMRRTSFYFYLTALSVADTSVLYLSGFKTWLRVLTNFELLHVSDAVCRTVLFLLLVSLNLSAWLVVLLTVDRFVAVWFPLRASAFCSRRRARLASGVLLGAVVVFNVHVFGTTSLQSDETGQRHVCGTQVPTNGESSTIGVVFEWLKFTSYTAVPFVVILALNIAIIAQLRLAAAVVGVDAAGSATAAAAAVTGRAGSATAGTLPSLRRSVAGGTIASTATRRAGRDAISYADDENAEDDDGGDGRYVTVAAAAAAAAGGRRVPNHTARVTNMLLTVSIAWLLLTAPFALYMLVFSVWWPPSTEATWWTMPRRRVVKTISFIFMYTNHAINFYMYCITGRKFRRELVEFAFSGCVGGGGGDGGGGGHSPATAATAVFDGGQGGPGHSRCAACCCLWCCFCGRSTSGHLVVMRRRPGDQHLHCHRHQHHHSSHHPQPTQHHRRGWCQRVNVSEGGCSATRQIDEDLDDGGADPTTNCFQMQVVGGADVIVKVH